MGGEQSNIRKNFNNGEDTQTQSDKFRVKIISNNPNCQYFYLCDEESLGRGNFGEVRRVYKSGTNEELAVKIISKEKYNDDIRRTIKNEVEALKTLKYHPNLVNYKKVFLESNNNYYLIMEYCNQGDLQKLLKSMPEQMHENQIKNILFQFLNGYTELKDKKILHRDIKLSNILVHNNTIKIADFGLICLLGEEEMQEGDTIKEQGSNGFIAPEIYNKNKKKRELSEKSDIYSLGVCLYRLMYKDWDHPYIRPGKQYKSVEEFKLIQDKADDIYIPDKYQQQFFVDRSPELIELVRKMLDRTINTRISLKELIDHPIVKDGYQQFKSNQKIYKEQQEKQILQQQYEQFQQNQQQSDNNQPQQLDPNIFNVMSISMTNCESFYDHGEYEGKEQEIVNQNQLEKLWDKQRQIIQEEKKKQQFELETIAKFRNFLLEKINLMSLFEITYQKSKLIVQQLFEKNVKDYLIITFQNIFEFQQSILLYLDFKYKEILKNDFKDILYEQQKFNNNFINDEEYKLFYSHQSFIQIKLLCELYKKEIQEKLKKCQQLFQKILPKESIKDLFTQENQSLTPKNILKFLLTYENVSQISQNNENFKKEVIICYSQAKELINILLYYLKQASEISHSNQIYNLSQQQNLNQEESKTKLEKYLVEKNLLSAVEFY